MMKPVATEEVKEKIKKSAPVIKQHWWLALSVIVVVSITIGGYYYWQHEKLKAVMGDTIDTTQIEQEKLIEKVGKLIKLPQNEQPAIATVSDIAKLKGQPFFDNAKNGDKVLIYEKAQKAILYDPQTNKLVEVGPVDLAKITPTATASSSEAALPESIKVVIYNGTTIPGLAAKFETQLLSLSSIKVDVLSKGNAVESNHTKTIIVDLTGKHNATAQRFATMFTGEVAPLPEGEQAPKDADILIIAAD